MIYVPSREEQSSCSLKHVQTSDTTRDLNTGRRAGLEIMQTEFESYWVVGFNSTVLAGPQNGTRPGYWGRNVTTGPDGGRAPCRPP